MTLPDYGPLAAALRTGFDRVLGEWARAFQAAPMRVPRPFDEASVSRLAAPVLESLADTLAPSRAPASAPIRLAAGSPEAREVEKAAAFLGASFAVGDAAGFDVAALMLALRGVLADLVAEPARAELVGFVEWLAVVAVDSFATARVQAERERWREQLEEGTPVLLVAPEVPAAFLIGRPDGRLLDATFSRLLLQIVRVGARTALVDASGLGEPGDPVVVAALDRFLGHPKLVGRTAVVVIGLEPAAEATWLEVGRRRGLKMSAEGHFDRAVERALEAAGFRLLRS